MFQTAFKLVTHTQLQNSKQRVSRQMQGSAHSSLLETDICCKKLDKGEKWHWIVDKAVGARVR